MESRSIADIVGPWVDPNFDSGLIDRCRRAWNTPIRELSNGMLATFLRQDIGTDAVLSEANSRLAAGIDDDSELFEGELAETVQSVLERRRKERK